MPYVGSQAYIDHRQSPEQKKRPWLCDDGMAQWSLLPRRFRIKVSMWMIMTTTKSEDQSTL